MPSKPAPLPLDEAHRLQALINLELLDSLPEQVFTDLAELAKTLCQAPIALLSLIDSDRQWFKACIGLDASQTPREDAFCAYAILEPGELLVVPDATLDPRFETNALVLGPPYIRFYAGAPVISPTGQPLGTLCVIDQQPRQLAEPQVRGLQALARQASALISLRQAQLDREKQTLLLSRQVIEALADDLAVHAPLRQGQRLATVGQLASGIAHDFNNALQAISSTFQLVQRRGDQPGEAKRLALIGERAVAHVAERVARLRAFSQAQNEPTQRFCVAERIASGYDLYVRLLGPHIELSLALCEPPAWVEADAAQWEAALLNLLVNARDALQGRGRITLQAQPVQVRGDAELADGHYIELSVSDNGPGMAAATVERAFEPFFTTKAPGEGGGLGLSQVYAFATQAGGTARIRSTPGQGTEVTLWLSTTGADTQ